MKVRDIEHAVEVPGEDVWLFSTDYPHSGTPWPDGVSMITDRTEMAVSELRCKGGPAETAAQADRRG